MTGKARTDSLRFSFQTPLFVLKVKQDRLWSALRIAFFHKISSFIWESRDMHMLCISTSHHMLAHAFAWSKMTKNNQKWYVNSISLKLQQPKEKVIIFEKKVGQRWEWLPKAGWLFYSFSNVFDHFRACERMRKHAFARQNTQHLFLCNWKYMQNMKLIEWVQDWDMSFQQSRFYTFSSEL